MKIDWVIYAFDNVIHRKLRSFLTVLSILIGVMAIYALVSFGLGIQNYIDVIGQEAGVDKLTIQARGIGAPGTDATFAIKQSDIDFVNKIKGVKEITGLYMKTVEVKKERESTYTFMVGIDMDYFKFVEESFTVKLDKGRTLKKGDMSKVMLGYNYQIENSVFKRPLILGDNIEINGKPFQVVGFYQSLGNPQDDKNIYATDEGILSLFPEEKDRFGYVMMRADKGVNVEDLSDRITEKLRKFKNQDKGKESFFVQSFQDALATFSAIILIINGILFGVALISSVVAAVNIMNTMYTSVLERTKEIGIMKAIGAKNSDIFAIFVFESGLLGMFGGIVGIFFGYLVAKTGGAIAAAGGYALLTPIFPWYLAVGCLLFAFGVGAAAGFFPARQASKLHPVDALRYE